MGPKPDNGKKLHIFWWQHLLSSSYAPRIAWDEYTATVNKFTYIWRTFQYKMYLFNFFWLVCGFIRVHDICGAPGPMLDRSSSSACHPSTSFCWRLQGKSSLPLHLLLMFDPCTAHFMHRLLFPPYTWSWYDPPLFADFSCVKASPANTCIRMGRLFRSFCFDLAQKRMDGAASFCPNSAKGRVSTS